MTIGSKNYSTTLFFSNINQILTLAACDRIGGADSRDKYYE